MVFLEFRREPGVYSRIWWGWPFKTRVCSATSRLLSSYEGLLRNLHEAWQGNTDTSRVTWETESPFLVGTAILGFLSIFRKSQPSSLLKH